MTQITIDNIAYDLDALSDEVKGQLGSLRFVDAEIARLQAKLAVMQTARLAYAKALSHALSEHDVASVDSGACSTAGVTESEPTERNEEPRRSSFFKKSSKKR